MELGYLKILFTLSLAMLGWFVTHKLNSERDFNNKKREQIISYLIDAYLDLEDVCHRHDSDLIERFTKLESALAKIQLFGTEEQINMAHQIVDSIAKEPTNTDPLLRNLRSGLRKELKLPDTETDIAFCRWGKLPPKKS